MDTTPVEKLMSIGSLFGPSESYAVPAYQREYAWGSEQIEDLITDFKDFLSDSDDYYLLGQIIAAPHEGDESWSLVDGQQRTTTIFILLCVLERRMKKFMGPDASDSVISAHSTLHNMIRWAPSFDSPSKPRLAVSPGGESYVLELITNGKALSKPQNKTQKNLKAAYELLDDFVGDFIMQGEDSPKPLQSFLSRLIKDVYVVRLCVPDQAQALDVFGKLNNRGLRLNSADLLKNLLFQKIETRDFEAISDSWNEALNILYTSKIKRIGSMEFLMKSMLSAKKGESTSNKFVYKGWKGLIDENKVDALEFGLGLPKKAKWLANLGCELTTDGRNAIANQGTSYFGMVQHLPILLAGAHLQQDKYDYLARLVEERAILSVLSKEPSQSYERIIAPWAARVAGLNADASKEQIKFVSQDAFVNILDLLELAKFNVVRYRYDSETELKRIRYVLARATRRLEIKAKAKIDDLSHFLKASPDLIESIAQGYHLDHIHPQSQSENSLDGPGWDEQKVNNIGNLTLLSPAMNISAGAAASSDKDAHYSASNLLITRFLATNQGDLHVTQASHAAAFAYVNAIAPDNVKKWEPDSVNRRAKLYWNLLLDDITDALDLDPTIKVEVVFD